MKYLVHCISGLQDVAWKHLSSELGPLRLLAKEDGFVAFEGTVLPPQLTAIQYINNCYLVIVELSATGSLAAVARDLTRREDWHSQLRQSVSRGERAFRLVLSDENQLVVGEQRIVNELRSTIARLSGLTYEPRGGGTEFWIMRRRSGLSYLCKRLTRRSRTEKDLRKGELRPEMSHLLCLLSEPAPQDIFLDAFAGSGAIPFARTRYPYNMIFAMDNDETNVRMMKSAVKGGNVARVRNGSPLIVHHGDARSLERISDGFIDKIVTDPPWGNFDRSLKDPRTFYREVISEFSRVLQLGGLLIMLLGDRDLAAELSRTFEKELRLLATFPLLVAGKKAVVCKWVKISSDS